MESFPTAHFDRNHRCRETQETLHIIREVKTFDLPEMTTVAIGHATKPYPVFTLPGMNRFSAVCHSNGDKMRN
jgi:hypothetical protein